MKDFMEILFEHRAWLEKVLNNIKRRTNISDKGSLEISVIKGKPRYYQSIKNAESGARIRKYLSEDNIKLIERLAQNSYDKKAARVVEEQIKVIDDFIRGFNPVAVREIHEKMIPARRELVVPEELCDEDYVKYWNSVEYVGGAFYEGAPVIMTNRGERVRSKSERDIANYYYTHDIPYRYEYPKVMSNGHVWHPDFLVLNVRTREEYYHEHLGKMDDAQYVNDNLAKIEKYIQDGLFPGDRMFFTNETSQRPFDVRSLEPFVKKYLL